MQICVLANSVDHVRRYLGDLPHQMLWQESLSRDGREATPGDVGISEQVLRILNLVHLSMDSQLRGIVTGMLKMAVESLQTQCEKLLSAWIQSVNPNQVKTWFNFEKGSVFRGFVFSTDRYPRQ